MLTLPRAALLVPVLLLAACSGGGGDKVDPASVKAPDACVPKFVYTDVKIEGEALDVVDFTTAINDTDKDADFTLTATHSATVSIYQSNTDIVRVHVGVGATGLVITGNALMPVAKVHAEAIFDAVHQQVNSVNKEATTTTGSQIRITIPAHATGYGVYAVNTQIAKGHLHAPNCSDSGNDQGTVSTAVPEGFVWCTWTRGPNQFTDGGQGPCVAIGSISKN